jgi:hypothetical protein
LQYAFRSAQGTEAGSATVTGFTTWGISITHYDMMPIPPDANQFTLVVNLKDITSGQSGSLSFPGEVMPGPLPIFHWPQTQSLTLGANLYQVTIPDSFNPKIYPLGVQANGQDVPIEVGVWEAPEPSALTLAAIGCSALGLCLWRRRKSRLGRIGARLQVNL